MSAPDPRQHNGTAIDSNRLSSDSVLAGGGGMGALMRALDWSKTPLGPVETWPQSLRTAVSILLNSKYPMFIAWGPELIFLYNDGYRPIFGAKHPTALGQPFAQIWSEIWSDISPLVERALAGEPTWSDDLLLFMERNGYPEETYFTFSYSPIRDETGGIGGMFCACTETTERVLAERRIRTLQNLGAAAVEAKTVADAEALCIRVLEANPRDLPFALLYRLDDGTARLIASVNASPDTPAAPQIIEVAAETAAWPLQRVALGEVELVENLTKRFGEAATPLSPWNEVTHTAMIMPITGRSHPAVKGALILGITPRRALDTAYRNFLQYVAGSFTTALANARAYEEEHKRAETLAELDRAKTTFFSNVSHEFRTPLTLMLGPVEDSLADPEHPLPPEQRERQEVVHRNALRLLKLVNSLLDFSRIEAGRIRAVYEPTDLAAYTAELAGVFRSAIEKAGLRLVVDTPPLPEPVYVDREMWEKIVLNLLSNTFKFTFEGEITVRLAPAVASGEVTADGRPTTALRTGAPAAVGGRPSAVVLTVRDTGTGIPEAEQPHLFERFHRVEGARGRTYEGTGIGLALVQELVRLHGGDVRVESTEGEGSTFTVTIPTGAAHLPADSIGASRDQASTTATAAYVDEALSWLPGEDAETGGRGDAGIWGHNEKQRESPRLPLYASPRPFVLLADDNADMRGYVARLLTQQRYRVEAVPNGAAALEAARRERPDLVLSDVMMPEMDGYELLQALRDDPATREVPFILLSARAGEEARVEGLKAGAYGYLTKPFSARELLARVGTHLEMARLRQEGQRKTEKARDLLQNVLMQTPAAIGVTLGPDHVIESVNAMCRRVFGERDYVGKPEREVFPETEAQGFLALMDEVYRSGEPYVGAEARIVWDRDGDGALHEGFFNFVYQPLLDPAGEVFGIVTFAVDVTAQVQARHRIEDLAGELKKLNETLEQQVEARTAALERINVDLRRSNRELQDFAFAASHDLREPLRKISTFADLLRSDVADRLGEEGSDYVNRMGNAAVRMSGLLNDLLAFSRIQTRGEAFRRVDLNLVAREVLADLDLAVQETGAEIEATDLPAIEADPAQVRQLLHNLIGNALKFQRPNVSPVIHVSGRVEDGKREAESGERGKIHPSLSAVLEVKDNGIGFDEKYLDRIFSPFQRLHGKSAYPGTGMGLAICRRIVERHGGALTARSTPGEGSTFIVTLPVRHANE